MRSARLRRSPAGFGLLCRTPFPDELSAAWLAPMLGPAIRADLYATIRAPQTRHASAARSPRPHPLALLLAWSPEDPFSRALRATPRRHDRRRALELVQDCRAFVPHDQPGRLAELIDDFVDARSAAPAKRTSSPRRRRAPGAPASLGGGRCRGAARRLTWRVQVAPRSERSPDADLRRARDPRGGPGVAGALPARARATRCAPPTIARGRARLAGRRAAGGAVPLRRRGSRLPLGRGPRRAPRRLPVRARAQAAGAGGRDAHGQHARRPGRAGSAAAAGVRHLAHRFIVAESPGDAAGVLRALWSDGVGTSVDLLGEATVTVAEAERYARRCAQALQALAGVYAGLAGARAAGSRLARRDPAREPVGEGLRAHAAAARGRAGDRRARRGAAPARAAAPGRAARRAPARRHGVLRLARGDQRARARAAAEEEFRDGPSAGLVLQAYLVDSPALCERILAWARAHERAQPLVVRLVKGAYWDHEVVDARQHGWQRARVRAQGRLRPQLRGAHAWSCCARAARAPRDREPQPAQRRARDRLPTAARRGPARRRVPGAARARRRPRHALAGEGYRVRITARSAT